MTRDTPPPYALLTMLLIVVGSMLTLAGLVWLALAYDSPTLLAGVLALLPVPLSLIKEQLQAARRRNHDGSEAKPTSAQEGT